MFWLNTISSKKKRTLVCEVKYVLFCKNILVYSLTLRRKYHVKGDINVFTFSSDNITNHL